MRVCPRHPRLRGAALSGRECRYRALVLGSESARRRRARYGTRTAGTQALRCVHPLSVCAFCGASGGDSNGNRADRAFGCGMNGDDKEKARFERARNMRNYAIAGILLFIVVLFFVMTMVRLGGHVAD